MIHAKLNQKMRPISKESLLQIPLVKQAVTDKSFRIQRRAITNEWFYARISPLKLGGFNPLLSSGFIPAKSHLNKWLERPEQSARKFNWQNLLLLEAKFLTHDYLHSWAYLIINELYPRLGFGTKPITKENFEDFVFCHLLSETVATVGLDYWYLCTIELNDVCPIGAAPDGYTLYFHEKWNREYRKFNPNFNAQKPEFFDSFHKFYCSGDFYGFSLEAFNRSVLINRWLSQEITYGETQRRFTRIWLHHLRSENFGLPDSHRLEAPVVATKKWQKNLIVEVGRLLWEKSKENKLQKINFRFSKDKTWKPFEQDQYDFRFRNIFSVNEDKAYEAILRQPNVDENFKFFFYQYLAQFDYGRFDGELIKLIPILLEKKDFSLIKTLFKGQKKVSSQGPEPSSLFFLN